MHPSDQTRSKVERLGYPAGTKLLIVHADDLGLAHSVNAATIAAFEMAAISSASVIVPAPWTPEIVAWATHYSQPDVGIHLTLTSEWAPLRWAGIVPRDQTPSLYDVEGFLPKTTAQVRAQAVAADVEEELRAQIARAQEMGLRPTHLDWHMLAVMTSPEVFAAFLRVARESHIPPVIWVELLRADAAALTVAPGLEQQVRPEEVLVDHYFVAFPPVAPAALSSLYQGMIRKLEPGTITQLVVHLGYDNAELQAVTAGHEPYGSTWRQADMDFVTNPETKQLLSDCGVRLTTWRELSHLMPANA